jgi:hypothetical protein
MAIVLPDPQGYDEKRNIDTQRCSRSWTSRPRPWASPGVPTERTAMDRSSADTKTGNLLIDALP